MTKARQLSILQQISDIAEAAGVVNRIDIDGERLVVTFTIEPGRTRIVSVHPTRQLAPEPGWVTLSSPCAAIPGCGANGAHRHPEGLPRPAPTGLSLLPSYEIVEQDDRCVVVANLDRNVDELHESELLKSLVCVALAAESYENTNRL